MQWKVNTSIDTKYSPVVDDASLHGYCCHIWAEVSYQYLNMLDKVQKQIRETFEPILAAPLELLVYYRNVASLNVFYSYCFGRYFIWNWLISFHSLIIVTGADVILIDCMSFLSLFVHFIKMFMLIDSFLGHLEFFCLRYITMNYAIMALSVELVETFCLSVYFNQISNLYFIFFFLLFL